MDRPVSSPHELVNSEALAPPIGFSHAVAAEPGRLVFVGGQTAHGPDGTVQGETVPVQFEAAVANLVVALEAAGARPEHLVSVQIPGALVELVAIAVVPEGATDTARGR
jgi:enamine deaminase RidA (YjgF/YER057c/UK114 family)